MSDPFVAEIRMFGGNFAPIGWAQCNGQLLPLSQNTALFSLLGTFYGGDGLSTFALPDMQGSTPMGWGQGAGLQEYFLGQISGTQFVTLLQSEIPLHTHSLTAYRDDTADSGVPGPGTVLGRATGLLPYSQTQNTQMNAEALSVAGGSLPHNNMSPYLTVNFIIAMQGIFPPRS
jgi:microcystin-dependent protein